MDSNHDEEYQKLNSPQRNDNSANILQFNPASGCSAGRSGEQPEGGIPDAELAALVAAWPAFPEPIKAAIRALVGALTPALPFRGVAVKGSTSTVLSASFNSDGTRILTRSMGSTVLT